MGSPPFVSGERLCWLSRGCLRAHGSHVRHHNVNFSVAACQITQIGYPLRPPVAFRDWRQASAHAADGRRVAWNPDNRVIAPLGIRGFPVLSGTTRRAMPLFPVGIDGSRSNSA
jgi:hypothetical protein